MRTFNVTETTAPRDYTIPPCPDWCALAAGHGYDSTDLKSGPLVRGHGSVPSGGELVSIDNKETMLPDRTLATSAPGITVEGV